MPDDAFVDESPRRPLLQANNPWTARVTALMAFLSLGLGMSTLTEGITRQPLWKIFRSLPEQVQVALLILLLVAHLVSIVGALSTLIHGLAKTGNDAAVTVLGRRLAGMGLGLFYFGCFASVWLAYALRFAFR